MANLATLVAGVNIRQSPSTSAPLKFQTSNARTFAQVFGKSAPADGNPHQWLELRFDDGTEGWARVDVIWRLAGDFTLLGGGSYDDWKAGVDVFPPVGAAVAPQPPAIAPQAPPAASTAGGRWSSPVRGSYTIYDGFHPPTHLGIDFDAPEGTPIVARSRGVVFSTDQCPGCPGGDGAKMGTSDPTTNWGFGCNVIVRVAYADLPATAQAALDTAHLTGGYLFTRTAHMQKNLAVKAGDAVTDGTLLGHLGTSGNSTGDHTHLECRASLNAHPANVFNEVLFDPAIAFAL